MERLTGPPRAAVPRAPVVRKPEPVRATSQNRATNNSLNKPVVPNKPTSITKGTASVRGGSLNKDIGAKKGDAKDLLNKMKEIKAHYNSQSKQNPGSSKNIVNKIS